MYSALSHDLMPARVADMHRQAPRDALARAARGGVPRAPTAVRAPRPQSPGRHRAPCARRADRQRRLTRRRQRQSS